MARAVLLHLICGVLAVLSASLVNADDPYKYYTWTVTYGTISPLGFPQQVILINGQFPGPQLDVVTNDNIILNLINNLDEPFLLTWNGVKQRKNSWQDGVLGTNCPIPPNSNYTYKFQAKDQIGTYTYFPSTRFHRAAGGYGGLNIYQRPRIPKPYTTPDGDFTLLIGDWFKTSPKVYPKCWTAILVSLDNQGMWNVRSAKCERQYLGQQFYLKVWNAVHSLANEYDIPSNALLCGKAAGHHP